MVWVEFGWVGLSWVELSYVGFSWVNLSFFCLHFTSEGIFVVFKKTILYTISDIEEVKKGSAKKLKENKVGLLQCDNHWVKLSWVEFSNVGFIWVKLSVFG